MVEQRIRLRIVEPAALRETCEFGRAALIGRAETADLRLRDSSISRHHAEIDPTGLGWTIRDSGSRNGTYLNGTQVGRVARALHDNDLLQCGNVVMRVEAVTVASPEPDDSSGPLKVSACTRQSLEQAADVLAISMTRSTRPAEQLLSLLRVGQGPDRDGSLDEFLLRSVQDAAEGLGARQGSIALIDPARRDLNVRATYRSPHAVISGDPLSRTLAQRCLHDGNSLLCTDVFGDAEMRTASSVIAGAPGSIICALLRTSRRSLGVLQLDRAIAADAFTPDDLRRADALALHLSSFIDSTLRFEESQRLMVIQTIIAFSQVIELRDEYTGGHTQRVTDYSLLLAEELGLPDEDVQTLRIAGPLHDIGKVGIDDTVLRKSTRLTPAEFDHMKSHTVKGANILQPFQGLEDVIPVVRNHHERWDGTGYPDGLAGEAIPRLARLVAVADSFDAMTSDRPYRKGMSMDLAFDQLRLGIGTQFDPVFAAAFLRIRPRIEKLRWQQSRADSAQGVVLMPSPLRPLALA
jgi:putative nucleotidyltransferase with HDIG domain